MSCARIAALVSAAALLASSAQAASPTALPKGMNEVTAESIRHAARVESFRLEPFPADVPPSALLGELGGWQVVEFGPDLTREEARTFEELLLNPKHYTYREKACMFEPRHALRFSAIDSTSVDLIVCFRCSQLSLNAGATTVWSGYFDPMGIQLKKTFEQVFARGRTEGELRHE